MTTTAPKQRSETAEQILDLAETLIQTRGYSALQLSGHRRQPRHPQGQHPLSLSVEGRSRASPSSIATSSVSDAALIAIADDQSQSSMAMLDFYVAALSAILPARRTRCA